MNADTDNFTGDFRKTVEQCGLRSQIVAVASGKGGVGKSNIAANLAVCVSALGNKVLLFDADLALGNIDLIMPVNSRYNISHLIYGHKKLEDIIQTGPEQVEIICASSGLGGLANINVFEQNRLLNELKRVCEDKNIILIDTAAGISKSVIGFCLASEQTLAVTTPQPTAMADTYALIKVLSCEGYKGRISLVVNMAETVAEGKRVYRQIANVAAQFLNRTIYEAGIILDDHRVNLAVRQRRLVVLAYPRARITIQIAAMAAKLINGTVRDTNPEGFFKKVVNLFC